jgi:hypothetical protein
MEPEKPKLDYSGPPEPSLNNRVANVLLGAVGMVALGIVGFFVLGFGVLAVLFFLIRDAH